MFKCSRQSKMYHVSPFCFLSMNTNSDWLTIKSCALFQQLPHLPKPLQLQQRILHQIRYTMGRLLSDSFYPTFTFTFHTIHSTNVIMSQFIETFQYMPNSSYVSRKVIQRWIVKYIEIRRVVHALIHFSWTVSKLVRSCFFAFEFIPGTNQYWAMQEFFSWQSETTRTLALIIGLKYVQIVYVLCIFRIWVCM